MNNIQHYVIKLVSDKNSYYIDSCELQNFLSYYREIIIFIFILTLFHAISLLKPLFFMFYSYVSLIVLYTKYEIRHVFEVVHIAVV